jgi:hypothetical protein
VEVDMNKIKILYYTTDTTYYVSKTDHYFKLELAKLPDVDVRFLYKGGDVSEIMKSIDFYPDFIYFDDFDRIQRFYELPTGLDKLDIPKGVLFHDLHRNQDSYLQFIKKNKVELLYSHYRDAFHKFFPQYKAQFRWLPLHVYKPIFDKPLTGKNINCLLMGRRRAKVYPLRNKMYDTLKTREDFVCFGHPGYDSLKDKKRLVEQSYADTIARAKIFLTCGSLYNYPLGKYYEVPACSALLMAPTFPELKDLGFIDKKTFVAINSTNFEQKITHYLKNKDERKRITKKGYEMVHARHTTDIRVREFVNGIWKEYGKKPSR